MANISDITLDTIESLNDSVEAFDICERFKIYSDDIEDLQDLKERLRLHVEAEHSQVPRLEKAADVFAELRENDTQRRNALQSIFKTIEESLPLLDLSILKRLEAENVVSESADTNVRKRITMLETGNCPILVAGETSSGKSTLLNLLLGKKILPEAHLSCTAAITRIKYGEEPRVFKVTHQPDGSKKSSEVPIKKPDDLCSALEPVLFPKGAAREDEQEKCTVDVYLPFELLKSGVYIIDSPGIGESGVMDDVVLDFIANNDVFAFIYVIMTDKSGGVQEDRLQKLLRQLQDMKDTAGEPIFDPGCAIFVCNRWDLVPGYAREKALENVRLAVSEGWNRPMDSSKQIFTLSAKMAWQHSQAGYMTHDYRRLVRGIKGLIPVSLQRRTEHVHRWGKHMVERTIDCAEQYLHSANLTRDELEAQHNSQKKRLDRLEKKSEEILKKLDEHLYKECETITDSLSKYLGSDPVCDRVTSWTNAEAPYGISWNYLEGRIEDAICKRIIDAIRSWETEEKHFETLKKDLFKKFTREFQLIESELRMIENMLERSSETDSSESRDLAAYMELQDLMDNEVNKMSIVDFNLGEKIALGLFSPIILPIGALGMLLASPAFLFVDVKKHVRKRKEKQILKQYDQKKCEFLRDRSSEALKIMAKRDVTKAYVDAQLQEARDHLQMMRESIPQLISSTRKYMQSIKEDQRSKEQLIDTYDPVVKKFTRVNRALEDFAITHLFSYDYNETDVEADIRLVKGPTSYKGNWTEVFSAILKSPKGPSLKISVKRYKGATCEKQVREDIIEMRKMKQQKRRFIPTILGTYLDPTSELPSLILTPRLTSLRVLSSGKGSRKVLPGQLVHCLLKEPIDCLIQLANALAYLHKNGFVCLDLSMDTVMITAGRDKTVKLVNISKPVTMPPPDPNSTIGSMVYLPYSVLDGTKPYDADANIYALGLMMWEVWHIEHAYKIHRDLVVSVFCAGIRQGNFPLKFESGKMDPTLEACWEKTMRACLSWEIAIKDCKDRMHGIQDLLNRKESTV
ncbi:uncharacterized protein LOC106174708 [Lingula anatina]|uniref:Uncharacterized protein LOC106174708 n=1 Tax=Lingula anatina TaxID=7574 RepID=A0A1S3JP99_LINAN|nr:uncharacterized protein LOC106174708 [Lingula anatina]|eukprot:XP_013411824.1 uncharacterized protein LOC106174708 [Lingula anatina]